MEQNFNNLTPAETERLAILSEECAEVIQIVGKILRHGYDSHHPDDKGDENHFPDSNRFLLEKELGHLMNIVGMMGQAHDIRENLIMDSSKKKKINITKYLHHQ